MTLETLSAYVAIQLGIQLIFPWPLVGIAGEPGRDGLLGPQGHPGPKGMKGDDGETGGIGLPGNDSLKCCQIKIIHTF